MNQPLEFKLRHTLRHFELRSANLRNTQSHIDTVRGVEIFLLVMTIAELTESAMIQAISSQLSCPNCGEIFASHLVTEEPISPVPDLLASTRVASESEAVDVWNVLHETQYDLHQLDNEIDRVRAILMGLQKKRDTLERHLKAHSALIAPIRILPWEVLSEIFAQVLLATDGPLRRHPKRQLYRLALLPGQVCRLWRAIALSTPRLWSEITLDLNSWDVDIAKTWISRSGALPLLLKVEWNSPHQNHLNAVFEVILNACERWKCIDVAILPIFDSTTSFQGSFSLLETLTLTNFAGHPPSTYNIFRNSPRLRTLHLHSAMTTGTLILPWSQLTELNIQHCWVDYFIDILGQAHNLVHCETEIHPLHDEPLTLPHIISNLRSLKVTSSENHPHFMDQMTLPALSILEYADVSDSSPSPRLLALLVRSQISLQKLVLTFTHLDPAHSDDILHILEMVPSLKELGLHYSCTLGVTNAVLRRLTLRPRQLATQQVLLPSLRVFKLCNSLHESPWSFAFSCLASMVLSRCWHDQSVDSVKVDGIEVTRLKGLYVHRGLQHIDMATYKRLFRCKNRGLDIEVAGIGGYKHIPNLAPFQG